MQQQQHSSRKIGFVEVRWAQEAVRLRRLAYALSIRREWLLRKARRCEKASQASEPLRPPEPPAK